MEILVFIIFSCFWATFFGHILHWTIHQPWMGRFYKSHMIHHLQLYPPSDFTSDKYRFAGKDSTTLFYLGIGVILSILPIFSYIKGYLSLIDLIIMLLSMSIVGFLHDYIHDAFHVNNHWMNKLPGFKKLIQLHYIHHVDMNANYGIFSFFWDKIFNTFKDKI